MVLLKKTFIVMIGMLFVIIAIGFVKDGGLLVLASADDKLFGDENKYIDPNLNATEINKASNLKDAYKFETANRNWFLKFLAGLSGYMKFMLIIVFILPIYFLFLQKDEGMIEKVSNIFSKEK